MAFVMLTGIIVVVFNLIADLLYAVLDPRIRYD
jgi:peptide/nickel transport system permease protein